MIAEYVRALANFAPLIDEKTGIIRSVTLVPISEMDPAVFLAHAAPCDTVPLTGLEGANRGAACSAAPERAIVRACGESIERYCSTFFDVRKMRSASESELEAENSRFVRVHDVYSFAGSQYDELDFPYRKVECDRSIRWVPATDAVTGERVWVPGSCVYVPYLFDVAVEPFTHMPISTGLAAGPSIEACIRKGICEILERDALMLVWYARAPALRIDPESCRGISPLIDPLLDAARGSSSWFINCLTRDIDVPVMSAALIDDEIDAATGGRNPPLTSFGISADPDPVRALLLALEEAALTRLLVNRSEELIDNPGYIHDRYQTLRDHLLAHATSNKLRDSLRFLTDAGPVVRFSDLVERERAKTPVALHHQVAAAGFQIIWVEVTTPDVADFDFRVVRTIIPGMQPLDNDHRYRYLGGRRLPLAAELNPDPHPFP